MVRKKKKNFKFRIYLKYKDKENKNLLLLQKFLMQASFFLSICFLIINLVLNKKFKNIHTYQKFMEIIIIPNHHM